MPPFIRPTVLCALLSVHSLMPAPSHGQGSFPSETSPTPQLVRVDSGVPRALQGGTNLTILSAETVDNDFNSITPAAGKSFLIATTFSYNSPSSCTGYALSREVNDWDHVANDITWGCDTGGGTFVHASGPLVLFEGGSYTANLVVDADNTIVETNESDNTFALNFTVTGLEPAEWTLTEMAAGRTLLGEGTDVIVGTMDDAFDYLHPLYAGTDSLGRPRLVAASQNTLGIEGGPVNKEHATRVMGATLARPINSGDMTSYAPDSRYVTAEFLNRAGTPGLPVLNVVDAAGFLVDNGVDVINMSWSWQLDGGVAETESGETIVTNLMVDYLAYGENIVCVAAVNQLLDYDRPTAPGSSRNVITVGGLEDDLLRAWIFNDHGPTLDGRSKPDVLGNDSVKVPQAAAFWRNGVPTLEVSGGTSAAAPHVTGGAAQLIGYGKANGEALDQKVIRAILTNSGIKRLDNDGSPWSHTETVPLDNEQGTGVINMVRSYEMYSAGQWSGPGHVPAYDLATVSGATRQADNPLGSGGTRTYLLGSPQSTGQLDVTLIFDRHTFWDDVDNNGTISAADTFYLDPTDVQDNLDLVLYRNGVEYAASRSLIDTTEYLHLTDLPAGEYTLVVERLPVSNSGASEEFALAIHSTVAWSSSAIFVDDFETGDASAW